MSQAPAITRPRTLFILGLTLLDRFQEQENAWVEALPGLKKSVVGVLVIVPSWQEAPFAYENDVVQRAISLCCNHGLSFYWGRNLWITWRALAHGYVQRKSDVYNPAWYAAYLSRLDAEGWATGAKGTFAACEPYGDTIFKPWFKADGFTWWQRRKVLAAISEARLVAPPATLSMPAGGQEPNHYSWALRYLGEQFVHTKTNKIQHPDQVNATPPGRMPMQLDWWRSWVTATGDGKTGALTIEQYIDLDWVGIRWLYPGLKGSVIFAAREDRLQVIEKLGG